MKLYLPDKGNISGLPGMVYDKICLFHYDVRRNNNVCSCTDKVCSHYQYRDRTGIYEYKKYTPGSQNNNRMGSRWRKRVERDKI